MMKIHFLCAWIESMFLNSQDIINRQHRIGSARNAVTEFLEQVLFSSHFWHYIDRRVIKSVLVCAWFDDRVRYFEWSLLLKIYQVLFPFLEDVPKGDSTQKLESLIANSSCCKQKSSHEYSIFHIFEEVIFM